eukprot:TRINITY_DN19688_c0_g1_i2.p1 TRINITY_DN19688_c0_g1~~TRINITY_DN19688_c0_g1_i2.p1  ORF type:complete len:474 (+),score=48.30 TRINITY_DN19688_c0_g1_i2:146-1423(+)
MSLDGHVARRLAWQFDFDVEAISAARTWYSCDDLLVRGKPTRLLQTKSYQDLFDSLVSKMRKSGTVDECYSGSLSHITDTLGVSLHDDYNMSHAILLYPLISRNFSNVQNPDRQLSIAEALYNFVRTTSHSDLEYDVLERLAHYKYLTGRYEKPCVNLRKLVDIANRSSDMSRSLHSSSQLAACTRQQESSVTQESQSYLQHAAEICAQSKKESFQLEPHHEYTYWHQLGIQNKLKNEFSSAAEAWKRALSIASTSGMKSLALGSVLELIKLHLRTGDINLADEYLDQIGSQQLIGTTRDLSLVLIAKAEAALQAAKCLEYQDALRAARFLAVTDGFAKDSKTADKLQRFAIQLNQRSNLYGVELLQYAPSVVVATLLSMLFAAVRKGDTLKRQLMVAVSVTSTLSVVDIILVPCFYSNIILYLD